MTKANAQRALAHSFVRPLPYQELFCLTPVGIRVGYPSVRLLNTLPARQRQKYDRRVILISTASAYYAINGIRVGSSTSTAAAKLDEHRAIHIGPNVWYLAPDGRATAILKGGHGPIQDIGLATNAFTRSREAERILLNALATPTPTIR